MRTRLERALTFHALDTYRQHAFRIPDFQIEQDRFIIISDAHMGDRRALLDEFQHNEQVLTHALGHYLNEDYGLIINGDMEEGWKHRSENVLAAYEDSVYAMERSFAEQGDRRHMRIWGNHDDEWKNAWRVDKLLGGVLNAKVSVHPAVLLGDRILIAHGHQGDLDADKFARFSRYVVQFIWQPLQTWMQMQRTVPNGFNLAWERREEYLYAWAKKRGQLLIAGHTHRPSFVEFSTRNFFERMSEQLRAQFERLHDPSQLHILNLALRQLEQFVERMPEAELAQPAQHLPTFNLDQKTPCYLNSGSCMSESGITGIEVDRGEIRLVKWLKPDAIRDEPHRMVIQSSSLQQMLAAI